MKFNTRYFFYFVALSQLVENEAAGKRILKGKPGRRLLKGKRQLTEWTNPPSIVLKDTVVVDPVDLANELIQSDSNMIISNVEFTGAAHAGGIFAASDDSIFGFTDGIVLSTGSIYDIVGPNKAYNTTTNNELPGDWDLDYFFFENTRMGTYDATSLKFDFECAGVAELKFEYTFMSEEYNEYVGSEYNDVFAFFLNGENVAVLPDGSNTAINSVHCGNPSPLDLSPPVPPSPNCNLFIDNEDGHVYTEMDGLTQVLTAQGNANSGVNTIKLAIADTADGKFDSAVLIKSGSFNCIMPTAAPTNPPTPGPTPSPTPGPTPSPTPGPTRNPTPSPTFGATAQEPAPVNMNQWVGSWGSNGGSGAGSIADIGGGGTTHGGGGGQNTANTSGRGQAMGKSSGEGSGAVHGMAGGEGFGMGVGAGIGYTGGFGGEGYGHGNTGSATYGDSGGGGGGIGNAKAITMGQNSAVGAVGAGDGGASGFGTASIGSMGDGFGEGYGYGHLGGDWRRKNRRRNLQWYPVVGGEGGGTGGAMQLSDSKGNGGGAGGGGSAVDSIGRGHAAGGGGGAGNFGAFGHTAGVMMGSGLGLGFGSIDGDGNTYGHGESFGTTGGAADGEAAGGGLGSGWSTGISAGQGANSGSFGGGNGMGAGTGQTTGNSFGTGFADGYAQLHHVYETDAPVSSP